VDVRAVSALLLLLTALVLSGCGGTTSSSSSSSSSSSGGSASAVKAGSTIQISETEYKLTPSTVNLASAGTYTFDVKNDGSYEHALTVSGNGVDERTATIQPGSSAKLEVTVKNGSYDMFCPISNHAANGMKGSVMVGGVNSGGSGGGGTTTNQGKGGNGY
jgi:uncharacterized cupredoxin-like copper-binding protein